jgi:hypothetical protein
METPTGAVPAGEPEEASMFMACRLPLRIVVRIILIFKVVRRKP